MCRVSLKSWRYWPWAWMGRSYSQPVDLVGVYGETGATGVLLITGAVDDDGVFDCACINPPIWSANVSGFVTE